MFIIPKIYLIFSFAFTLLVGIYCLFLVLLIIAWYKTPTFTPQNISIFTPISVVIAVRNEENNLLALMTSLEKQIHKNFEVLVVNDHSTDNTLKVLHHYKKQSNLPLKIIDLGSLNQNLSSKKAALKVGIQNASGKLIVTTDGDCTMGEKWLTTIDAFYQKYRPKLISSGVVFHKLNGFFEKLQSIEFMSLIGTGASSIALKSPNMSNGANLAFPKSVFEEVGGYQGFEHIPSGDDEFLMHKIQRKYPNSIRFLKSQESVIYTLAQESWEDFYFQRIRWASKWTHYKNWKPKFAAILVFFLYSCILISYLGVFVGWISIQLFCLVLCTKLVLEFFFLINLLSFYSLPKRFVYILILNIIYPFYAIFFGILGTCSSYSWKERKVVSSIVDYK